METQNFLITILGYLFLVLLLIFTTAIVVGLLFFEFDDEELDKPNHDIYN